MLRQLSPDSDHSQKSAVSQYSDALAKHISSLRESIQDTISGVDLEQPVKYYFVDNLWFQIFVILLTLMNTAQMGLEADHPEWSRTWVICETVFTAGFLFEMIAKLSVMKWKYFHDRANCLDFVLVMLGVLDFLLSNLQVLNSGSADLQTFSILRILRLARLARILKLVRAFKPLVLVIRGLTATMSTLGYVLALLLLVIYVVAILLKMSLGEPVDPDLYPGYSTDTEIIDTQEVMLNYNPAVYFGSMWLSMITLFNMTTFNEWQEVLRPIALRQPVYVAFFLCYALFVAFGVMNVMTGLIVDSVISEAKSLDEAQAHNITKEKLRNLEKVQKIIADMDLDRDDTIDQKEISDAMKGNALFSELLKSIELPSAWSADELLHLLDNNGDGSLQKSEFTTSFFRLLESNHFQQVCMLQASINQAKRIVNCGNEDIQKQLSVLQAELCSIKNALCPEMESQARPAADSKNVAEKVTDGPRKQLSQQYNPRDCADFDHATETSIDDLTPGIFVEFEERVEQISYKLLVESLDSAYTVMRESFKEELKSLKPRTETRFIENAQTTPEPIEMWFRSTPSGKKIASRSILNQNGMQHKVAPSAPERKNANLQSARVNLAAEGLECTEGARSVSQRRKRSILDI